MTKKQLRVIDQISSVDLKKAIKLFKKEIVEYEGVIKEAEKILEFKGRIGKIK